MEGTRTLSQSLTTTRYLTIIGYMDPSNAITLLPGYATTSPDPHHDKALSQPEAQPIAVSILDQKGGTLAQDQIAALPFHGESGKQAFFGLSTTIPFPEGTGEVRFTLKDQVIHTIKVPSAAPSAKLTWQPPADPVTGAQVITWEGSHPQGAPLHYLLAYSHDGGQSQEVVSLSMEDSSYPLDFDQLPGGKGQLTLFVTDGANTIQVASAGFSVPIKPCFPVILSPADGAQVAAKQALWLEGQGAYREEQTTELEALQWYIDGRDTQLRGSLAVAPNLTPGSHTITLVAGTGDRTGKVTISITAL
jgi:hypothetical protein